MANAIIPSLPDPPSDLAGLAAWCRQVKILLDQHSLTGAPGPAPGTDGQGRLNPVAEIPNAGPIGFGAAYPGRFQNLLLTEAVPGVPVAKTLYADSGHWAEIARKTAAGDAGIPFATMIDSRFSKIRFQFLGVRPANDNVALQIQISLDGGATWKNGATDYFYASWTVASNAASGIGGSSAGATVIQVANGVGNATNKGISGHIELPNPSDSTHNKIFTWNLGFITAAGLLVGSTGTGAYQTGVQAINGVQFNFSAGNVADGTIVCEGMI